MNYVQNSGIKTTFRCKKCHSVILLKTPAAKSSKINSDAPLSRYAPQTQNIDSKKGLGLRSKTAFLFVVIPIILVTLSGLIRIQQMNTLSAVIIRVKKGHKKGQTLNCELNI
jgi:hypothetical protein